MADHEAKLESTAPQETDDELVARVAANYQEYLMEQAKIERIAGNSFRGWLAEKAEQFGLNLKNQDSEE